MIPSIIIFIIFVILLYAYTQHHTRFASTASAVQQIWSGKCRLSCRRGCSSDASGLSDLAERNQTPAVDGNANIADADVGQSGPSYDCICHQECPCALIEKVMKTCSPVTSVYTKTINMISSLYFGIIESVNVYYNIIGTTVECGATCQRRAELVQTKEYDSCENIIFDDKARNNSIKGKTSAMKFSNLQLTKIKEKTKSIKLLTETKSKTSVKPSKKTEEVVAEEGISKAIEILPARPEVGKEESTTTLVANVFGCAECIQKGKLCVNHCPNAQQN